MRPPPGRRATRASGPGRWRNEDRRNRTTRCERLPGGEGSRRAAGRIAARVRTRCVCVGSRLDYRKRSKPRLTLRTSQKCVRDRTMSPVLQVVFAMAWAILVGNPSPRTRWLPGCPAAQRLPAKGFGIPQNSQCSEDRLPCAAHGCVVSISSSIQQNCGKRSKDKENTPVVPHPLKRLPAGSPALPACPFFQSAN